MSSMNDEETQEEEKGKGGKGRHVPIETKFGRLRNNHRNCYFLYCIAPYADMIHSEVQE